MYKTLLFVFVVILSLFIFNVSVLALENNIFGIHVTQTEDLLKASELINSNGGDWGYVTVVIAENASHM